MILKVLLIVSFISICVGDQTAKHATSSHSFHREDLPLSYKYSAVHVYTTVKPTPGKAPYPINYYKPSVDPMNFRNIQYAPLLSPEEHKQSGLYTKISIPKDNEHYQQISDVTEASSKKDYLEPRLQTSKNTEIYPHLLSHVQYIPGHNIEVLQNANRNPGHNAVYRSYQGSGSNDKYNKVQGNYLRHHIMYEKDKLNKKKNYNKDTQNVRNGTEVGSKQEQTAQEVPYLYHLSDNVYNYGDIIPQVGIPQEMYLQKPLTKMHALFLNVARTFNQAAVPQRSILHPGASMAFLGNTPTKTQAFVRAPGLLPSDSSHTEPKTRLMPIHKNLHYASYS